jgi:Amt family ammonium transporter
VAERIKFHSFIFFSFILVGIIYPITGHWIWGGGFLASLGMFDFAGSTVVHSVGGWAALAGVLLLGSRTGKYRADGSVNPIFGHNMSLVTLGGLILWFGWFGFNAGSALSAGETAAVAFFATQVSAGAAAVSWVVAEWILHGKPTTLGAASGAVAGLVAITPAAGFVGPVPAILIGLVAGALCYVAIMLKNRFGYDDALDVVAVHGVGGFWGSVATGLFASTAINSAGADGLFYGNPKLVVVQIVGAFGAMAYCALMTFVIMKLIKAFAGIRISEEEEVQGLDLSQHSEVGYSL